MKSPRVLLVGAQRLLGPDSGELTGFYGETFRRLTAEVRETGARTRYVGYQGDPGDDGRLHFLGIEVERIYGIPQGMVAWDLDGLNRTVWQQKNGRDEVVGRDPITWLWHVEPLEAAGRWCGEFRTAAEGRSFHLSANAYVAPGRQGDSDQVALVDYDPSWPRQAGEMAVWLQGQLGREVALRIEHYGSTAIEGMPAKPVVDLLVEVPSFLEGKAGALRALNNESWEYWWYSGHMTFVKRAALMGRRTHHVHMAPRGHEVWDAIAFRDYLRSHTQEAARYAALKSDLAAAHRGDRERYTAAKTDFVRRVTSLALEERRG